MSNAYVLVKVPLSYVNLRAAPNSSAQDIGDIKLNAIVDMLREDMNGWANVGYMGSYGYVSLQGGDVVFMPIESVDNAPFHLQYPVPLPAVVTQPYGANPEYYAQFGLNGHEGIDYAASMGSPVYAAASGTVKLVAPDDGTSNYGTHIRLTHAHGADVYETIYAHLAGFSPSIKQGDAVANGQCIGYADSTGNSTGNHLHFTLKKNGVIVNPEPYIA